MKKSLFTKFFVLIIILSLVITAFVGCGGSEGEDKNDDGDKKEDVSEGEGSEEKIVLNWVGAGWLANGKADELIKRFTEKYPNVEINYNELNDLVNDEFFQKYDTMIAAGDQVDMVYLQVTDVLNRAMNDAMLPITQYIQDNGDDFEADYGEAANIFTVNDEVYGVPMYGNTFRTFYNKDWFEQEGITIPENWTWDDFYKIAKQFAKPDEGIYGCFIPLTWQELTFAGAEQGGWKMIVEEDGKAKPNFDDEKFKKNAEFLYKISMEEEINPDLASSKAEQLNRRILFADKKAPMIVDSYYALNFLQMYQFDTEGVEPLDFEIGVAEMPRLDESVPEDVTYGIPVGGWGIPKTAKYPEWGYKFARFVTNDNPDLMDGIPIYKDVKISDMMEKFTTYKDKDGEVHENVYPEQLVTDTLTVEQKGHFGYYKHDPLLYAKYQTVVTQLYYQQYELYFTGQQTLDEFVENMQQRAQEEMDKLD